MTVDDLTTRFELARQSVASWSNDLIAIVRAEGEARETGRTQPGALASARRMLRSVEFERQDLAASASQTPDKGHELAAGVETALAEMDSLVRQLSVSIKQLEKTADEAGAAIGSSAGTLQP